MSISICQLYFDFKGRVNTWQGGHARPSSFESWVHEVQIEILNDLVKSLGNSQTNTDNLRFMITSAQVPLKNFANGSIIEYPKDYRGFSSMRFFSRKQNASAGCLCNDIPVLCSDGSVASVKDCEDLTEEEKASALSSDDLFEKSIEMVGNNFWGSVGDDELVSPSYSNVYATQNKQGFKVLPKSIGWAVLDYIAIPKRPVFKYITDPKGNIVCQPGCVDLSWGEEMIPEIMARLKKRFSGFTGDREGYKEGEEERTITKS